MHTPCGLILARNRPVAVAGRCIACDKLFRPAQATTQDAARAPLATQAGWRGWAGADGAGGPSATDGQAHARRGGGDQGPQAADADGAAGFALHGRKRGTMHRRPTPLNALRLPAQLTVRH